MLAEVKAVRSAFGKLIHMNAEITQADIGIERNRGPSQPDWDRKYKSFFLQLLTQGVLTIKPLPI